MNQFKVGTIYLLQTMPEKDYEQRYICVVKETNNVVYFLTLKNPKYTRLPMFLFIEYSPKEITEWLS